MSNFAGTGGTIGQVTGGIPGTAPNIYTASTVDALATITAVGYLNDIQARYGLKNNDIFNINYSDTSTFPLGEASIYGQFIVVVSGSNYSLVAYTSVAGILMATTTITAAQFDGMYAAPVLLVAAPGAGKTIVPTSMQLIMTYGSVAFANGGVVAAQWTNTVHGGGVLATNTEAAADFFATANTVYNFAASAGALTPSVISNQGIYLSNATGAFTGGTGTSFTANVFYRTIAA